jgi:hypothetical protein
MQAIVLLIMDVWLVNEANANPNLLRWVSELTGQNPVLVVNGIVMLIAAFAIASLVWVIRLPVLVRQETTAPTSAASMIAPVAPAGATQSIPTPKGEDPRASSSPEPEMHLGFPVIGPGEMVEKSPPAPQVPSIPNGGPARPMPITVVSQPKVQPLKSVVLLLQARRQLVVEDPEKPKK